MILRRVTEHVKAQNWFAVCIDFFIVVVGVFIGIQVSKSHSIRVDRISKLAPGSDRHLQDYLPPPTMPDLLA